MVNKYLSPTTSISSDSLQDYELRKPEQILSFVENYPALLPLLIDAQEVIRRYFPNTKLALKMFVNPEVVDDASLVILIKSNYSPRETLDRFDSFNDDWGFSTSDRVEGRLTFNLEF
jgi:hypothetical protein